MDGKVAQRNAELTKPIIDKVNEILHRICTEEKIMRRGVMWFMLAIMR